MLTTSTTRWAFRHIAARRSGCHGAMIAAGELGEIRMVHMQFAHGFHSEAVELANPSARWRVDPKHAGPSYVLGDLATHPYYIA